TGVAVEQVDADAEKRQIEALEGFRRARDSEASSRALDAIRRAARDGENLMPASIEAARAGVTTGEWAAVLREVFGEYRAPTGVADASAAPGDEALAELREKVERVSESLGRRFKILVGKHGHDGHSNGAGAAAARRRSQRRTGSAERHRGPLAARARAGACAAGCRRLGAAVAPRRADRSAGGREVVAALGAAAAMARIRPIGGSPSRRSVVEGVRRIAAG